MKERNKGIVCILFAAFFFSLMTVFIRAAGELPTMEKVLFRNLVASVVSFCMLIREENKLPEIKSNLKELLMRSAFGTVGMVCNFYAIDNMNISDANMLNKLSPFFAIIMSIFILKEMPKRVEWIAIVMAIAGAMLVVKPGLSINSFPGFIGLLGGLGAGIAYTFIRKMGKKGARGTVIVWFFSTFTTLITLPFFIINYVPMTGKQLCFLLFAGLAATGGQFSITAAYKHAPAKEISVFDYTQVIFAAIWGMLLFGQLPDILSILGYIVIIGAAVLRFLYNKNQEE